MAKIKSEMAPLPS